jgi:hypothetical protein
MMPGADLAKLQQSTHLAGTGTGSFLREPLVGANLTGS